jgi:hypothetical protein
MSVELNKAMARRVAEEGFDNTSLASELFALSSSSIRLTVIYLGLKDGLRCVMRTRVPSRISTWWSKMYLAKGIW